MSEQDDFTAAKPFGGNWKRNRGGKVNIEPKTVSPMDLERDRRKVERAMAKRARQMSAVNPVVEDRISEYDKTLFGRPVRIEIDVCVPIDDLLKLLNGVRADITNAMMILERSGPPNDRRFSAHQQLQRARAKAYLLRQDLLLRGKDLASL
jgi:hypothetical protein